MKLVTFDLLTDEQAWAFYENCPLKVDSFSHFRNTARAETWLFPIYQEKWDTVYTAKIHYTKFREAK